jgi:uncharacterized protein (TIGR03067 family)
MKKLSFVLFSVFLVSCAPTPKPPAPVPMPVPTPETPVVVEKETPPVEKKAYPLEGMWKEIKNQQTPVNQRKIWTFKDKTVTINDGADTYGGTFTVKPDTDPKEIDFAFEGYPVNKGIYRITDSILTVKVLNSATDRPANFDLEDTYTLIICVRENAEGTGREPAATE